ncbi:stage V sporulation protein D [Porphyromonas macacae]|uniref:Stage V sporulation protein D n=1 Tax=Porphyromonas macacae TaxID=28115 RepID=A0A379EBF6_9PORP|nr:stage V sporulation protein D [Porphyromonas macacae]
MLYDVVWKGTGKPVQSEVVSISGKTGTAQLAGSGGAGYLEPAVHVIRSLSAAISRAKSPNTAVLAVVREPNPIERVSGRRNVTGPIVRE